MIKLIASDVDGTVLKYTELELNKTIFDMIGKLYEKGILFVAASGRPLCELKHLFAPVADKMGFVCSDGAITLIGSEIIDINTIEKEPANELIRDIYGYRDCEFLVYASDKAYTKPKTDTFRNMVKDILYGGDVIISQLSDISEDYLKIAVYNEDGVENIENYFLDKYAGKFEVTYAANKWIEFNAPQVSKAVGIEKLKERLGITTEECMAFGDSYNDLTMFESVGHSYAMSTAKEIVKANSKYVCDDVESTIRRILL